MASSFQILAVDLPSRRNLVQRLQSKSEILRFEEDPLLASLCTCLGLEFEVGNPAFDRLTPYLGGGPGEAWERALVLRDGEIGIRLRRANGQPLEPRHPDLAHLLDRDSIDSEGRLSQALFFPRTIAEKYRQRGFHLVIVRDWILNSALSLKAEETVSYLLANEWEIRTRIAETQAPMMTRNELAFFGTHDIVDHLFGADAEHFAALRGVHEKVVHVFNRVMEGPAQQSRAHLLLGYLIGIALDDLAQPRWYGSTTHAAVVEKCLEALLQAPIIQGGVEVPEAFHTVAALMRAPGEHASLLQMAFDVFQQSLSC